MRPQLGIVLLLSLLTACDVDEYSMGVGMLDEVNAGSAYYVPMGFQVGDTVDFVAVENIDGEFGTFPTSPNANSALQPSLYTWWSNTPDHASMIEPGRFVMLQLGEGSVTVETARVQRTFSVTIVPRIAAVRISPRTVTMNVGDSVTFEVDPLDASGEPIVSIKDHKFMTGALSSPSATGRYILILLTPRRTSSSYPYRAVESGEVIVVASVAVYRVFQSLRDTAIVTVK